jgi:hypothetical protein
MTTGTQPNHAGSHRPWLPITIPEPTATGQVSNHHQAIHPASFPQRTKKTKISSAVFYSRRQEARAKGPLKGSHQLYRRNETAQSSLRLSSHSATDQSGVRIDLDKDTVRRILAVHYKPDRDNRGPSWLTTIGHAK